LSAEKRRLKLAAYWAASCGGCDTAIISIDEKLLELIEVADIEFWPIAMDVKYRDVEEMPDKHIDVCLFNGAIRLDEQEYMAKLLRRKSKILVAYGSCSYIGGIPGLANLFDRDEILTKVYKETPSTDNPAGITPGTRAEVPEGELRLPEFYDTVKTLNQVVSVDYYVPGCPPETDLTVHAIEQIVKGLIEGKLPPKGSVLAPQKSVCDECPRKKSEKKISEIRRPHEVFPDPETCLLEQGILCMGPATRGGCGAKCPKAGMPCIGCEGPCPDVSDQGAAMISALASIAGENVKGEDLVRQLKDMVGTFYTFSLPSSIINRRRKR